jgi:glycosyltransferase involved in cell wall biosynthesis
MSLLLIVNTPPPYQGTTIMNKYLIDHLRSSGRDVVHLGVDSSKSLDQLGKIDFGKISNVLFILRQILRFRYKFELAYLVMSVDGFAFYRHSIFIFLLKLLGKPYCLHLRGLGFQKKKGLERKIVKFIFKSAVLIQHSPYNAFDIKGLSHGPVHYIANGWEDFYPKYETKIEDRLRKVNGPLNIVFLSNLIEDKGLFTVLDAISCLPEMCTPVYFHFIGNWSNNRTRDTFYEEIDSKDLSKYIGHVGPLYNDEKYSFLSLMDVLVFPTYYKHETWGNVILEAMMFKMPVIATNYVAIPEMVKSNVNGFLINPRDSASLARHIIDLCSDRDLRLSMSEASRHYFLESFTLDVFLKRMEDVLFNKYKY